MIDSTPISPPTTELDLTNSHLPNLENVDVDAGLTVGCGPSASAGALIPAISRSSRRAGRGRHSQSTEGNRSAHPGAERWGRSGGNTARNAPARRHGAWTAPPTPPAGQAAVDRYCSYDPERLPRPTPPAGWPLLLPEPAALRLPAPAPSRRPSPVPTPTSCDPRPAIPQFPPKSADRCVGVGHLQLQGHPGGPGV
jgi:hypothetical protein